MTTQKSFHQIISPLATKFHEVVDAGRFRAYYNELFRHSERELEQAVCKCGEKCQRFPKIDEIEQECK